MQIVDFLPGDRLGTESIVAESSGASDAAGVVRVLLPPSMMDSRSERLARRTKQQLSHRLGSLILPDGFTRRTHVSPGFTDGPRSDYLLAPEGDKPTLRTSQPPPEGQAPLWHHKPGSVVFWHSAVYPLECSGWERLAEAAENKERRNKECANSIVALQLKVFSRPTELDAAWGRQAANCISHPAFIFSSCFSNVQEDRRDLLVVTQLHANAFLLVLEHLENTTFRARFMALLVSDRSRTEVGRESSPICRGFSYLAYDTWNKDVERYGNYSDLWDSNP
uniref:Myotubularin phosphatase domain-containing protein n=1 Tax=Steinernema glaseri TaxID=37863 RepID=A0A1I7ZWW6_9BILA